MTRLSIGVALLVVYAVVTVATITRWIEQPRTTLPAFVGYVAVLGMAGFAGIIGAALVTDTSDVRRRK